MAAGAWTIPAKSLLNTVSATGLMAANAANFKAALLGSGLTVNDSTQEVYADVSGSEIAAGNGYSAGGVALTGVTLTLSGNIVTFTASPFSWTASGGNIPAWRHAYLYYVGTLNGKVNPLVAHCLGDSTPADVPATTPAASPLTVTPHASGIISITKSP